ncbi:MAG: flavodoxin, partial [Clostridia bacterium]|nr:flavodoxin [Clostridia bacterium]
FVKQYDLAGKKVVLFARSGGSDIGKTVEKLQPYLSAGTTVAGAKVFSADVSEAELKSWIASL